MKSKSKFIILNFKLTTTTLVFLAFGVSCNLFAISKEAVTGVRPMGMGGAFTAVADDFNASVWNPAALDMAINRGQFGFSYVKHFEDVNQIFMSVAYPTVHTGGFGFYVNSMNYGTFERRDAVGIQGADFSRNDIFGGMSYGKKIFNFLYAGAVLKYTTINLTDIANATGIAYDLSVLVPVHKILSFGAVMKDIGGWKVKDDAGSEQVIADSSNRLGFALRPAESLLIAADMDGKDYSAGLELNIYSLSLRTGALIQQDSLSLCAGMGYFSPSGFRLDYAFLNQNDLGQNHRVSMCIPFGSNIATDRYYDRASIEKAKAAKEREKAEKEAAKQREITWKKTLKEAKDKILAASPGTKKPRVAIIDFTASEGGGVSPVEASTICDDLETALFAEGVYELVERRQVEKLLNEQAFQMSGVCDDDKACMAKASKVLNVRLLIFGKVKKYGETFSVNAKIVDAETSDICIAPEPLEYELKADSIRQAARKLAGKFAEPFK